MTAVRWTPRRKAAVVDQVMSGEMTAEQALRLYGISDRELCDWIRALRAHGVPGLRSTRLQCYQPERRR